MRRMLPVSLLALVAGAMPLIAQGGRPPVAVTSANSAQAKSPTLARIIGILPGAGHMYAGETGRGFAYLGGILGVALIGGVALAANCIPADASDCDSAAGEAGLTVAVVGLWGWSIYDAGRAAHRTNFKRGVSTSLLIVPVRSTVSARGEYGLKLGVSFAAR